MALTGNASEAYRLAYPSAKGWKSASVNKQAYMAMQKPHLAARVEELRAEAAKRHEITVESVLREYDEAITLAKTGNQASAMVSAITKKAELFGLFERHQRQGATQVGVPEVIRIEVVDP
jgi:hypothetical protein